MTYLLAFYLLFKATHSQIFYINNYLEKSSLKTFTIDSIAGCFMGGWLWANRQLNSAFKLYHVIGSVAKKEKKVEKKETCIF